MNLEQIKAELQEISEPDDDENLNDFIKANLDNEFIDLLNSYMNSCIEKGLYKSETEIYKKAGCPKQQFHKMKNDPDYKPSKHTILCYALACHLNRNETLKLLASAGFTLANASKYDLIINYCLKNRIYNFDDINLYLVKYGYEKPSELFGVA